MKPKISHKLIASVVSVLLILGITGYSLFFDILVPFSAPVLNLDKNWTVTVNDVPIPSESLPTTDIGIINENDVVVISNTLPEFDYLAPCLTIYTVHALLDIYVDGELIYTLGHEAYDKGLTVPKFYSRVPISDNAGGKNITIIITGAKDKAFSGLSAISLGEMHDLFTAWLRHNAIYYVIGLFLIVLGIILIILSPYLVFYHNNDARLFFSGLISLLLGLYISSYFGLFCLLTGNASANTICEYAALYNIPTAICGYLQSVFYGKKKSLFRAIFILDIILFISSVVMHVGHIYKFTNFTPVLHTIAITEGLSATVIILHYTVKNWKSNENRPLLSDTIFFAGLTVFMISSIVDIISFNIYKFHRAAGEVNSTIYGFTFGAVIFTACLLVSYLYYNIYSHSFDAIQNHMVNLAYTDALTGLSNRARCEQVMSMLTEERSVYAIISLDLNKLKQVNDTLGHHEGDRLLTGFATILSDCFWDANLIGRMGGDEFIVILMEEHSLNCTKRIHDLYSIIDEWNRKEIAFQYSTSYGYAYSYEVPTGSAKEVYMLADSRMYEMKREHQSSAAKEVIMNA